ncbi:MAG: tRNA pseudouridine(55) synthase TruB [Alicyclobacillus sp.]|nr:tRNA pseudouridine(55) synthase TruB [Alicyclobacillus sp.]
MTSHDVVSGVRRVLGTRRVGHAGTLDPDVTGVLVLCVGEATRLLEYAMGDDKAYTGVVAFGISTDTDDASGRILQVMDAGGLTEAEVRKAARELTGDLTQVVPRYAAVRVAGRRLYEYARAGQEVVRPVRQVRVNQLEVLWFAAGSVARAGFSVRGSKGLYVRALCRDWGAQLHLPAHMAALRRTASGPFTLDEAVPYREFVESATPERYLLPPLTALRGWPCVQLGTAAAARLSQGQAVPLSVGLQVACNQTRVAVVGPHAALLAVAEVVQRRGQVLLRPMKVFGKREP